MKKFIQNPGGGWLLLLFVVCFFLCACASIPRLRVSYNLPPDSRVLEGKKARLVVNDNRSRKNMLGPEARDVFKNFAGDLSFSIARSGESASVVGIYDPMAMVREGFRRRLRNQGVDIETNPHAGAPRFVVDVNRITLDLVGRRWMAAMDCRVELTNETGGGKVFATQSVTSRAERLKLFGTDEADRVMSDVFTDLLNRVEVEELFRRADLL